MFFVACRISPEYRAFPELGLILLIFERLCTTQLRIAVILTLGKEKRYRRTAAVVPRRQVAQINPPFEESAACPFIEAKSLENLFARTADCVGHAQKIV